jgi:hypothetical protein
MPFTFGWLNSPNASILVPPDDLFKKDYISAVEMLPMQGIPVAAALQHFVYYEGDTSYELFAMAFCLHDKSGRILPAVDFKFQADIHRQDDPTVPLSSAHIQLLADHFVHRPMKNGLCNIWRLIHTSETSQSSLIVVKYETLG